MEDDDIETPQTPGKTRLETKDWDSTWALSVKINLPTLPPRRLIVRRIVQAPAVKEAMDYEAIHNKSSRSEKRVKLMTEKLISDIKPTALRMLAYIFRKVFTRWYDAIYIEPESLNRIKQAQKNGPVLLLPTHRSHMDYIVLGYVFASYGLQLPHAVSGDNLNFKIIGNLLKGSGAVYIRRQFGDDRVYRALFKEYMKFLLEHGCSVECYIEGGRTRSGKLNRPKNGFIKILTEILEEDPEGTLIPDVTIFPISIAYDKVVEGRSYVREVLGSAKEQETLSGFLEAVKQLVAVNLKLGSIDVVAGEPISFRGAMKEGKYGSPSGIFASTAQRNRFISRLSYGVVYECNRISTIPTTSVVAAILLTLDSRGINLQNLVERVDELRKDLLARGARISYYFEKSTALDVTNQALAVLGRLVKNRHNILYGFAYIESLELSFYRNQLIHWFINESLVACAMMSCKRQGTTSMESFVVSESDLLHSVRFLSKLLKYEFIYREAPDITENLKDTVLKMQERVTSLILSDLKSETIIEISNLANTISRKAEDLFYQGLMDYYEVVSVDTIKSALTWFIGENLLTVKKVEVSLSWSSRKQRLIQLAEDKCDSLQSLTDEISLFRKYIKSGRNERSRM